MSEPHDVLKTHKYQYVVLDLKKLTMLWDFQIFAENILCARQCQLPTIFLVKMEGTSLSERAYIQVGKGDLQANNLNTVS